MTTYLLQVAVDFDGVLHAYRGWEGENVLHGLVPGAREFLHELASKYRVIVYTTRAREVVLAWLNRYGLVELVAEVTNEKPKVIAFVDDRAVRFTGDFHKALHDIEQPPWWGVG